MRDILAFLGLPGGMEWGIILIVGLLIFGRRLPEIARSVGKSVVEFKRGLKDVKNEIGVASTPTSPNALPPGRQESKSGDAESTPEANQADHTSGQN